MMKSTFRILAAVAALSMGYVLAEEDGPIKKAMQFAHKAPKGEKKLGERIIEGAASEEETKQTLEFYKAMVNSKPPQGDEAAFKAKVEKLVAALQEVVDKKPDAIAHYKEASNCKACHSEHKPK